MGNLMETRIPKYETVEEYEQWLFKSCLTETFLNKVRYVYTLESNRQSLSVVWSNDLKPIIKFMAKYYFGKYAKRKERRDELKKKKPIGLTEEEKKERSNLLLEERRDTLKEENPDKYDEEKKQTIELTKKSYYNRTGENRIIGKIKKQLSYLDLETIEYSPKEIINLKKDIDRYKGRIHKAILIIKR